MPKSLLMPRSEPATNFTNPDSPLRFASPWTPFYGCRRDLFWHGRLGRSFGTSKSGGDLQAVLSRQELAQKGERLCPTVLGGLSLLRRFTSRVLETVADIRVTIKVVRDAVPCQFGIDLIDNLR